MSLDYAFLYIHKFYQLINISICLGVEGCKYSFVAFGGGGWGKGGSSNKETMLQVFSSSKAETRFLELKYIDVSLHFQLMTIF